MLPFRRIHFISAILCTLTLLFISVIEGCSRSAAEAPRPAFNPPGQDNSPAATPGGFYPDPARLPALSGSLPADLVSADSGESLGAPSAENPADRFAWDSFIALNWPTLPGGEPDHQQLPGQHGDNTTVWETWPDTDRIFLPGGIRPPPWGAPIDPAARPPALRDLPPETRILAHTAMSVASLAPGVPEGPLIDQNGRQLRLETRVNRPVFETLLATDLYRREAQLTAPAFSFPAGGAKGEPGSIRVQAAWKILSAAEIAAGRFHAVQAVIFTPATSSALGQDTVEHATVGLVGLHIVRKTPSAPGWIWSSFEHVDNCPTAGEPADRAAYNFFDKNTPVRPVNQPPAPPWDPALVAPPSRRSQIVRQIPIPEHTRALNAAYHAALRAINPASPWQYYELIGTQYREGEGGAPAAPDRLANTTLETYLATSGTPAASCADCHAKATSAAGSPADSSFLLRLAQ